MAHKVHIVINIRYFISQQAQSLQTFIPWAAPLTSLDIWYTVNKQTLHDTARQSNWLQWYYSQESCESRFTDSGPNLAQRTGSTNCSKQGVFSYADDYHIRNVPLTSGGMHSSECTPTTWSLLSKMIENRCLVASPSLRANLQTDRLYCWQSSLPDYYQLWKAISLSLSHSICRDANTILTMPTQKWLLRISGGKKVSRRWIYPQMNTSVTKIKSLMSVSPHESV